MAAPKGNQYTRKYTEEEAVEIFERGAEWAKSSDECLCLEDVILHLEIPVSSFYYLLKEYDVLEAIKKEMHIAIISRINKGAVNSKFAAAPAIWRLKQMGESEQQNINVTSNGQSLPGWMNEE